MTLPDGYYHIFVVYITRNAGGRNDYINFLDKDSCRILIDAVYEPHYTRYGDYFGNVLAGFFSDEPPAGNVDGYTPIGPIGVSGQDLPWSKTAMEMFTEVYGSEGWKKLTPYLWGAAKDKKQQAKVRNAYMDMATKLIAECFSAQNGEWCRAHGVEYIGHQLEDCDMNTSLGASMGHFFRGLSGQHMAGVDNIGRQVTINGQNAPRHDRPACRDEAGFYQYMLGKLGASHGAIDPKKQGRCLCENFGAYGWQSGPKEEKFMMDHFLVRGVNRYVPHAFSPAPFPDPDCPPHFYAHGENPTYRAFGELMAYGNRVCHLIDGGKPCPDVALLYNAESVWYYWYENWSRQGFDPFDQTYRGKEIHDSDSDSWYWLDNVQQGARAVNKDVYQESLAGEWGDSTNEDGQKTGKWIRYDENGQMVKGWDEKDGHKYYFDPVYGTMAKSDAVIDGESYYFDETTSILTDRSQEPTQTPDVTEKPVSPDVTEEPDTPDVPEFDYSDVILKDGEDDVTAMTLEEWVAYENHMDYAEIFTNITSYTHEDLRAMLDMHWSHLLQFPTAANGFFDPLEGDREAQFGLLKEWHNFRVQMQPTQDAEAARIYLWPEGQVPTTTEYTENSDYAYADAPDFVPFMLESLLPEGTTPKGAVLISPGGGHNYRSNVEESLEVAMALNEEGYQCFIVNYRVEPYSDAESALDIARAVRIVRSRAAQYGISEDNIALAGFSYGGIVASLAADRYAGDVNASAVVSGYVPDAIDGVSADINAYLAIYSVTPCAYTPNTYPEITNPNFPPTFFGVGDADGVRFWAQSSYEECQSKGIKSEYHEFTGGVPHGFGAGIHADGTAYPEAQKWPSMADDFMQEVYADAGISAYAEGMISEEAAVEVPEAAAAVESEAAEEPETATEEPEAAAEESEAVAEESEAATEESETVTEEPEAAAADAVAGDSPEGETLVPAAE